MTKTAERKIVPTPSSPFFSLSTQDDNGDCFRIVIMRQTEAGISVFILGAAATEAKKSLNPFAMYGRGGGGGVEGRGLTHKRLQQSELGKEGKQGLISEEEEEDGESRQMGNTKTKTSSISPLLLLLFRRHDRRRHNGGRKKRRREKKGSFMALFRDVLFSLALVYVKLERGGHQNSWLVVHWRERETNIWCLSLFVFSAFRCNLDMPLMRPTKIHEIVPPPHSVPPVFFRGSDVRTSSIYFGVRIEQIFTFLFMYSCVAFSVHFCLGIQGVCDAAQRRNGGGGKPR